ncbi:MAG: geranylgeranyl pyrophosphate synthase [halophilic archaeon J07HB67]|jgi:farnesyl-diphosphate synthase (EC 2.5.1.10)/geranylgeranyl-diphosphate synthase (EC 2.5.1.29)|nr:MAG: geranylgeranyl pyrophosphate synthase [halophilic archaeon J07HB67]
MSQDAMENRVLSAVRQRREVINGAVGDDLPMAEPERLYEATRYIIQAGGKRLRPTMSLLVGESLAETEASSLDYRSFPALDGGEFDLLRAAMSVEAIQSFTLIHDDIMDEDDLRRGVPAVHVEYDTETAILAGDTLYSKAFEMISDTGARPEHEVAAMHRLASTCTQICEGQSLDVAYENRTDVSPEEYLEMVRLKTAVLFGASAAIPASLMGADDEVIAGLHQYGTDIGRAFQIQDDLLDLTTPSEQLGKQRGSDLVEGKETMVTLHARQQGVEVDSLVDADTPEDVTETAIEEAVGVLEEVGSIQFARDRARELAEQGRSSLAVLPDNEPRQLLDDLAEYLIIRSY